MYCFNCGEKLILKGKNCCSKCKTVIPDNVVALVQEETKDINDFNDISENIRFAVLLYLGPLCFLGFTKKESDFCLFHAFQGLVQFICLLVSVIFYIKASVLLIFALLFTVFFFIFSVAGILNVLNGEKKPVPVLGVYIEKFRQENNSK